MSESDQYKPDCGLCEGDGWWYVNPEQMNDRHLAEAGRSWVEVQATFGAQGNQLDWKMQEFGWHDSGSGLMTMQRHSRVGYMDRFVATEQVMAHTELLERATGTDTVPVGRTGRTTGVQKTAMRYEPLRINFVAKESGGSAVVYYEGTHFRVREPTLTEPARLLWLSGQGPSAGDLYTVHYDCHPVWVVVQAPYGIQGLQGPPQTMKGELDAQVLPTTFKVMLDFLTGSRGT